MQNSFYYKGKIYYAPNKLYEDELKYAEYSFNRVIVFDKVIKSLGYLSLSDNEINNIKNWLLNVKYDGNICAKALNKLFENIQTQYSVSDSQDIIFEIVEDENKDKYAREIYTGLLFPLVSKSMNADGKYSFILEYHEFIITFRYKLKSDDVETINSFVDKNLSHVASEKDIELYRKQHSQDRDTHIKDLFSKNEFERDVVLKELPKVFSQDEINDYMASIELNIALLSRINSKLASLFQNYYDYLKSSKTNNFIFTRENLSELDNELKIVIRNSKFNKNEESIDKIINNIYSYYATSNEISSNLDYLLSLNDIVMKNKNSYSPQELRELTIRFSLLYLIDLIINKRNASELKGTYVEYNYKTIFYNMINLDSNNKIDIDLDYIHDYSFEEVIELINNLNIKDTRLLLK